MTGTVNPGGAATTYHFESRLDHELWYEQRDRQRREWFARRAGDGRLPDGLLPNTIYHYRIVATNNRGTTTSEDRAFTTLPLPPSATTFSATAVGFSSASLQGQVDLQGGSGTAYFEYGTTSSHGTATAVQPIAAGPGVLNVMQTITGLLADTTYHFRVVATNASGSAFGADQVFTTAASAPPIITTDPANRPLA